MAIEEGVAEEKGATRDKDGGPVTNFDMEVGEDTDEKDVLLEGAGGPRGVISNPAQYGPLGSGSVNIGPGTGGGSESINSSGAADITGDVSATVNSTERTGGTGDV